MTQTSWRVLVVFCLLLLILTGCGQGKLSAETVSFTGNEIAYRFSLPEKWEAVEAYKEVFNQAAVFGAEDSQSTARMFIRVEEVPGLAKEDLIETTQTTLEELYSVEGSMTPTEFEVGEWPGVYYLAESTYKKRKMWVHLFYVATDTNLVEFQFYSPDDQSDAKRKALFEQSVQTLKETGVATTDTSEGATTGNDLGTMNNDIVDLQITGYKQVDWTTEEDLLVLRFTCVNVSTASFSPKEQWSKGIKATAGSTPMTLVSLMDLGELDSEIKTLLEAGEDSLEAGKTREAAVVYLLPKADRTKELLLTPDVVVFPEKEAIRLANNNT
ncbi:hypothetical protein LI951_10580 [Enterococcus sp. BWT-B8]|uniref:hypothetical protein n=1 Tax=unclassified Enterococcus TaxID=2608891 RepID=UPI001E55DC51|nr:MULTISPECIES: hypothetical protein [unclassified Enterococcus]MCB5952511.1 hypothetical protein [Enterococcus sp. BWT-B8]MCB5953448.1 hypothetical protein [Enterococcus sp. CWB-B31]